jgi:hypothetical protein
MGVQLPDPYGITKSCWDNDVNKWPDISYPDIYQYIDRGFLVSEEFAAHGVTLRMPSFTRGKKQLSAMEVH